MHAIWIIMKIQALIYTAKNNPVKKKMVNYWQLWLPASYRKNTVCYCF